MKAKRFLLAAVLTALAFTLSCSGSDDSQGETAPLPEYAYCVYVAERICVDGPFTACTGGGTLGNSCPFQASTPSSSGGAALPSSNSVAASSSSAVPSSSSAVPSSSSVAASSSSAVPSSSSTAPSSSSMSSNEGTFTDNRDGKIYKTIKIGTRTWMAENLNYAGEDGTYGVCYDNDPDNCEKYGRLYDWKTAMNLLPGNNNVPEGTDCNSTACNSYVKDKSWHDGICPKGWYLPTNAEWDLLYSYAEGSYNSEKKTYRLICIYSGDFSETAGLHLKAKSGWLHGNGNDTYGFAALPGGTRDCLGNCSIVDGITGDESFSSIGDDGFWWSATEGSAPYAYYRNITSWAYSASCIGDSKRYMLSVRCVR